MDVAIDAQDYIEEIVDNIKKKDKIKADIIISFIADMDRSVQEKMLFELSKVNNSFTVSYLIHLLEIVATLQIDDDEIILTLQDMLIQKPDNLIYLFKNPQICNKIDVVDLATVMQSEAAVPYLVVMMNKETGKERLLSILEALGAIGSPEAINAVSEYLYSVDEELTYAAIEALNEIGTPDAVEALARRLGSDIKIDTRIIDIFVKIQDEHALGHLNEVMRKLDPHTRNYAKSKLIQIGQKVVPIILRNLECDDPEFIIHSLNILAVIGDKSAVNAIRQLLFNEPKNANIRFAAYEALGMLPLLKGVYILSDGLVDKDDIVRNAAAKAIEKNNNKILQAGITNLIKNDDENAKTIVAAFLNVEADSIFRNLFYDETFQKLAIEYLSHEAHPDIRAHFGAVLKQIGYEDIAKKINPAIQGDSKRLNISVVDDSRMLLKVYKSNLHAIGFDSKLYEFPASALEQIKNEKPDVVITDLNMPEITGIELTAQLREKYSKEDLPIILITTQTDKDETQDAYDAGISGVIYKPFTKEQLKTKIEELV